MNEMSKAGFVADKTMTGGCECRQTLWEVEKGSEISSVVACHCGQCNRSTSHFLAAVHVADATLTYTKDEHLKVYTSSDFGERGFCSNCGSNIFWRASDASTRTKTSLMAGTFDDQSNLVLDRHIFVAHKAPYYDIPDDGALRFPDTD